MTTGWKNCEHGWRKGCYQCTPEYLELAAKQLKIYSEALMYDVDALSIAKTFDGNAREYFLNDDKEIMILKGKYNV